MAKSGTIIGDKTGSYYVFIEWESTPNVETNTSTFTMRTYISHPKINISARTGSTTIDGKTASYKRAALNAGSNDRLLVNTRVETIQHNDDGTKEIDVSASFPFDLDSSSHGRIRTKKASGKCVLDDIPRASEVTSHTSNVDVNGSNTWSVTLAKHSGAFRHKATLTFKDKTHTTDVFDTTASFAIPMDWLKSMTDRKQGEAQASIQTYSDSSCKTAIGDPVVKTFTITASDAAKPTIADGWASVAAYNEGVGVGGNGFSVYVQGYSKAAVTFDGSKVAALYGADIASVKIEWDGTETEANTETAPCYTKVLSKSGEQKIRCTVTDTRGLINHTDLPITVEEYYRPTLSNISIYRCNSKGEMDDAGTFLYFKAKANIAPCGSENGVWMSAYWKTTAQPEFENRTALQNDAGSVLGSGMLSTTTSYNARILIRDYLNNTASFEILIPTADASFNIKKGGKGAAFGKYAQKDGLLDVEWDIHSDGAISGEDGRRIDRLAVSKTYADDEIGGGFKAYGASHKPTVYRAGPHVYLRGIVSPTAKKTAGSTMYTLFTLPEWARPPGYIDVLGHGSTTAITWIRISPEGVVTIGRYRSGDTYLDIETTYQLTLYAAWIAADAIT